MGSQIRDNRLKNQLHEIIFEADTPAGRFFDVALLIFILASVLVVMLESVAPIQERYKSLFIVLEWVFTIFFTIEYVMRLYAVYRPWKYALSIWGIIDLLATLPGYISFFFTGANYLLMVRGLRLLRIFRIFKAAKYLQEGSVIVTALKASRAKISVFLYFVMLSVLIIGSLMYMIEGGVNPSFSSIPRSIYWAIVTLTTVGYGDIHPITEVGQFFAAIVMILGYAIIAVPTGIVSAEMVSIRTHVNTQVCRFCAKGNHADDAIYCKHCGEKLNVD